MNKPNKNIMDKYSFSFQISEYRRHFGDHLTIEQAAYATGLKPIILKRLVSHELIEIMTFSPEPLIHVERVPEIKKIARLHYDLGIGWNSMGVVLDLLKRIDELEGRSS